MMSIGKYRFSLCIGLFLSIFSPLLGAMDAYCQTSSQQSLNIPWNSNSITVEQLQALFRQYPTIGQFNIQFPNMTNWSITPDAALALYKNYQQQAQSLGLSGNLPDLSFSSLAVEGVKAGVAQLSVNNPNADLKTQIGDVLQSFNSPNSSFLDWVPDWFKDGLKTIFDTVYDALQWAGNAIASLFSK